MESKQIGQGALFFFLCPSSNEFILRVYTYAHRKKRERRKKNVEQCTVHICMLVGSEPFIVLSHIHTHIYIFFYEFFTAQLNTIDDRVFDMDLYI